MPTSTDGGGEREPHGARRIFADALRFDRVGVDLCAGFRVATGIAVPLTIGLIAGELEVGLVVAIGALLVGVVDVGAGYRVSAHALVGAAVGSALGGLAGFLVGETPVALVLAGGGCAFAAGMATALGNVAWLVGLVIALALVVAGEKPAGLSIESAGLAGLLLAGGVWQAALAVAAWPLERTTPARRAVATVYRALAEPGAPGFDGALLRAEEVLSTGRSRRLAPCRRAAELGALLDLAEDIRGERAALDRCLRRAGDGVVTRDLPPGAVGAASAGLDRAVGALAGELATFVEGRGEQGAVTAAAERVLAAVTTVEEVKDTLRLSSAGVPQASRLLEAMRSAQGIVETARRALGMAASHGGGRRPAAALAQDRRRIPLGRRTAVAIGALRQSLTPHASAFRHAVRLSSATTVAIALWQVVPLAHGAWAPVTAMLILRPQFGATMTRAVQRLSGTFVTAVGVSVLAAWLAPGHALAVAIVWVSCIGLFSVFAANYGLATVLITAEAVFLADLAGAPASQAAADRALDTAIGGGLALAACVLWPTWERTQIAARLADLLEAARGHVAAHLTSPDPRRAAIRPAATFRAAHAEAAASVDRMLTEPGPERAPARHALAIVAAVDELEQSTLALAAHHLGSPAAREPLTAAPARAIDGTLADLARSLRDGMAPAPLPALGEALEPMARELERLRAERGREIAAGRLATPLYHRLAGFTPVAEAVGGMVAAVRRLHAAVVATPGSALGERDPGRLAQAP